MICKITLILSLFILFSIPLYTQVPEKRTNKVDGDSPKFQSDISFNDYKVKSLFKGIKTPINYKSNPIAQRYKTILTRTYKATGLNFAGHYCFVTWGCGTSCQTSAVIDLNTGKVYDGPTASLGYDFRKNSRMIIVNPPAPTGSVDDCVNCQPQIWIWDEHAKKFKQKIPSGK